MLATGLGGGGLVAGRHTFASTKSVGIFVGELGGVGGEEGYTFIATWVSFVCMRSGTGGRVTWSVDSVLDLPFLPLTICFFGIARDMGECY